MKTLIDFLPFLFFFGAFKLYDIYVGTAVLMAATALQIGLMTLTVAALDAFLATEDGANLLAGYRRAVNILKAETKKNPNEAYDGAVDAARLSAPEEKALAAAVDEARQALDALVADENFAGAMTSLAALRKPVDAFFDRVLVNDPDLGVRLNRLRLLSQMRDAAGKVADFSLITG